MSDSDRTPYIVLLGDVGAGKSTIVEKLSGETGRSSAASSSVTKCTETFTVPDGSLIVADCPGSNAIEDKLGHNLWIACAFNFRPVSKADILTLKHESRILRYCWDVSKVCLSVRFVGVPFLSILCSKTDLKMKNKKCEILMHPSNV